MQSIIFLNRSKDKVELPFFEILPLEQSQPEQLARPHIQNNFEIVWIQEGVCTHTLNQQQHFINQSNIHCSVPGQEHHLSIEDGSKGFIISFNESFLNGCYEDFDGTQEANFFRMLSQTPVLAIDTDWSAEMEGLALKLLKEKDNHFLLKNEMLSKYLKIFFIYLRRQFETTRAYSAKSNNRMFNNFLWLLENNYREKKAVSDYAAELSVTPSYLNHVIKKTSGYPASHHIQQRIVLEAKRKAKNSSISMKEVAYYLGFDDLAHFSKFFKTSSGMNFTTFKNSSQEARA
jgi:AraC-like DNA-binding protein